MEGNQIDCDCNTSLIPRINMAETAIGIVGLLSLFTTAVDGFNYVKIARSYDDDFAVALLRLKTAGLRLSRWGEAVGIYEGSVVNIPHDQYDEAEAILKTLFKKAQRKAATVGGNAESVVHFSPDDMSHIQAATHEGLTATIGKRINRKIVRTTAQAKWALYKKAEMDRLLKSIDDSIDFLESLIPAMVGASRVPTMIADARSEEAEAVGNQILQDLADKEVVDIQEMARVGRGESDVTSLEVMRTLQEAITGPDSPDPYLEKAATKALEALIPGPESKTTYSFTSTISNVDSKGGVVAAVNHGNVTSTFGRD